MKLSKDTITILKNFAGINPGLKFTPGRVLKTIHIHKAVVAIARIEEEIEGEANIYDLNKFLSVVGLMDDPDIDFGEKAFTIKSGNKKVSYTYASEAAIITPPDKEINFPEVKSKFELTWDDFENVIRFAGVLKMPVIQFSSDGDGEVKISLLNPKDKTSDTYTITTKSDCEPFEAQMKVDYAKILPRDYTIEVSSKIVKFEAFDVTYYIALESN